MERCRKCGFKVTRLVDGLCFFCDEDRQPAAPVEAESYAATGSCIGAIVDAKQVQYGRSFGCSGDFLRLLYPDGVKVEAYDDLLTLVRIFDKMKRIATDNDPTGESPYSDIVGYGLLAIRHRK